MEESFLRKVDRAAHQPSARHVGYVVKQCVVRRHGVVNTAAPGEFQPLRFGIDENGRRLLVDEQLTQEDSQKVCPDNGDVLALSDAQFVRRRFGKGDVVQEERLFVVDRIGKRRHVFGRQVDEIAQISVRRASAQQKVVLRKVLFLCSRVGRIDHGVQQHARSLRKIAHAAFFRDHADGVPPRNERPVRPDRPVKDRGVRPVQKDFSDAHAHLSLLAGGVFRLRMFDFTGGGEFPHVHMLPLMEPRKRRFFTGLSGTASRKFTRIIPHAA